MKLIIFGILIIIGTLFGVTYFSNTGASMTISSTVKDTQPDKAYPVAYLGGGCFWCLESQVRELEGVIYTRVGYQGGNVENPTYEQISTGQTGHAEVVEVTYNPELISYTELITFFLTQGHDATQLNRQGVDVGTQYRSVIFYGNDKEKTFAVEAISTVNRGGYYTSKPIVTEISPLDNNAFWIAEDYHQQYYEKYEEKNRTQHIRVRLKDKREPFTPTDKSLR